MNRDFLEVRELNISFGGVRACNNSSMIVREGDIHAIIGPNGAGKTTLVSLLAGELRPDSGHILLGGEDITALPVHRKVDHGIARSYQITSLFESMTVVENVMLAGQRAAGLGFSMRLAPSGIDVVRRDAMDILRDNLLDHLSDTSVRTLSYGDKRTLEICVALACKPKVLILDEPMAGMGVEESQRIVDMLARLKGRYTIVLVEHDMDAVFRLADRITVLVQGTPIITDDPGVVRADPHVRAAYLGEEDI